MDTDGIGKLLGMVPMMVRFAKGMLHIVSHQHDSACSELVGQADDLVPSVSPVVDHPGLQIQSLQLFRPDVVQSEEPRRVLVLRPLFALRAVFDFFVRFLVTAFRRVLPPASVAGVDDIGERDAEEGCVRDDDSPPFVSLPPSEFVNLPFFKAGSTGDAGDG